MAHQRKLTRPVVTESDCKTKICRHCLIAWPIKEFHIRPNGWVHSYCRRCNRELQRAYYKKRKKDAAFKKRIRETRIRMRIRHGEAWKAKARAQYRQMAADPVMRARWARNRKLLKIKKITTDIVAYMAELISRNELSRLRDYGIKKCPIGAIQKMLLANPEFKKMVKAWDQSGRQKHLKPVIRLMEGADPYKAESYKLYTDGDFYAREKRAKCFNGWVTDPGEVVRRLGRGRLAWHLVRNPERYCGID